MDAQQIREELFEIQKELNYINAVASKIRYPQEAYAQYNAFDNDQAQPQHQTTNCPNCGAPAVNAFCEYCGTRL